MALLGQAAQTRAYVVPTIKLMMITAIRSQLLPTAVKDTPAFHKFLEFFFRQREAIGRADIAVIVQIVKSLHPAEKVRQDLHA